MKRAISALNCQIEEIPAPLFYKCRMFCIHDSELNRANYYENPHYEQPKGYEKELVDWLRGLGVQEVYSLKFRTEMQKQLELADIKIHVLETQNISVEEIIDSFEG